jgi:sugar phosphate isomerase/epimerase
LTPGVRVRQPELGEATLDAVLAHGFRHVEWHWPWDVAAGTAVPTPERLQQAARNLRAREMTVSVAGPNGLSLAEKVRPLREVSVGLWRGIHAAAAALGARWMVLELGGAGLHPDDRVRKAVRIGFAEEALAQLLADCEGAPPLLLENQRRLDPVARRCHLGDDAGDLVRLCCRRLAVPLGVMFDTGHALIGRAPGPVLDELRPHVLALALHANGGDRDEHRALQDADVAARPDYWLAVAELARRVPVVVEIDDLGEARRCLDRLRRVGGDDGSFAG